MREFPERKKLNLANVANVVLNQWEEEQTFKKSIASRDKKRNFVFYEGPPSSNGLPGIHHVMARTIKDVFCRYKTLKGFRVNRKAGWDTHGLPVELGVEKELQITKEDIGKTISVKDYNNACKKAVMKYTNVWNDLTKKMGYWVDMDNPYITYENKYIESVWWILKQAYSNNLIYKGYTVQPYSPKAGTGLSSHELNQPGCYKMVKDTSVTAQFLCNNDSSFFKTNDPVFLLAWTTTPWTLPSNTALAINRAIDYVLIKTFNQYTHLPVFVILAERLVQKVFSSPFVHYEKSENFDFQPKKIPYQLIQHFKGSELEGLKYEQLLPYALPEENPENAFRVIHADYVSVDDGTGIVHIAPTFGADDALAAKNAGIPAMLIKDKNEQLVPLVNLKGMFREELELIGGKYVKNEYYENNNIPAKSVDVEIAINLKEKNRAFKVEKYEHSYPHCWRTDKPILYYPLDSWFIKVSDFKNKMFDLNQKINWKPPSTGTGRFGNWLQNANDWNLSRSRFWGIPIPIWRTEDKKQSICIGSVEELKKKIDHAIVMGVMSQNPLSSFIPNNFSKENYNLFDLHRHFVDDIILCSEDGQPMHRENDLIDVWFDSGSMPFAQWHYPFENKELIDDNIAFPADFIAEGVDQTRGWFYTLHAIATMTFKQIAYKNVISNGLVLDKSGQKMSKRLGNAIDPFTTLEKFGPDATRWYMITNAQPWDNLKFDLEGIQEVTRKFFGTISNTYSFFSLYANLDKYNPNNSFSKIEERSEIDRWIISKLNSLKEKIDLAYGQYEPTKAGRLIQDFVINDLSNWFVRLCRKRFWKGSLSDDKIAAYDTLYTCLKEISILMSPIAPFYSDQLYQDLTSEPSVHLALFPSINKENINEQLEYKMKLSQEISSLVLSIRKKVKIKVRQPLKKILIPTNSTNFKNAVNDVNKLILSEVNVKEIEFISSDNSLLTKKVKPNFKTLGPLYGKEMKNIAADIIDWSQKEISEFETLGKKEISINNHKIILQKDDVHILTDDVPGWEIASNGEITVALDIKINHSLKEEGIARDLVNKIQNIRKDLLFNVTDNIEIKINTNDEYKTAINNNLNYICSETLAEKLSYVDYIEHPFLVSENENIKFSIEKIK